MKAAKILGTSTTKSETRKAYATFRVTGDALDPAQITRLLRQIPTVAYAKDDQYFAGERTGYLTGRTGVWLISTSDIVASDNIQDHLSYIAGLFIRERQNIVPLTHMRAMIARRKLRAELSVFWHGVPGARKPAIPRSVTELLKLLPAEVDIDFDTDHGEEERRRA